LLNNCKNTFVLFELKGKMKKVALCVGGSSGAIYAQRLMYALERQIGLSVSIVFSKNAVINWNLEIGEFTPENMPFKIYENNDFFAPFASGSAKYDAVIICPCSMGLLGRIANGLSDDLMCRAADVMLKERKKLILVPRETPFNLIHLRNMTQITEAGGIICPAMPSFYSKPQSIEEAIDTVVHRIIDLLDLDQTTYRWGD
jgi:flavin prenyltransferase